MNPIPHPSIGRVEIAGKIVAAMSDPFHVNDQALRVTTSVGVAYLAQPVGDEAAKLIKLADMALYSAKAAGRNTYQLAEPAIAGPVATAA